MSAFENMVDIDLTGRMLMRSFVLNMLGEGDEEANTIGARIYHNGEDADLTGFTVSGYFTRADGTSVILPAGVRTGNLVSVTLPAECYDVQGNFTLSLKLVKGDNMITVRVVDGTVIDTIEGTIVAHAGVVPDITTQDWADWVAQVEAAADTIEAFDVSETLITGTRYRIVVTTA